MAYFFNPWRRTHNPRRPRMLTTALAPFIRLSLYCGFTNLDYAYVQGDLRRLHVGKNCSTMNTIFNVVSGDIYVGNDTLFSYNCQVLTGIHRFHNGKRASLQRDAPFPEVPVNGRDIRIGRGCFVGPGAMILGGVTVGDNVVIGAGAIVTVDVADGCFVAGVPAHPVTSNSSIGNLDLESNL